MSTRSYIGIKNEDDTLQFVYCHWDGYPDNNGSILLEHYQDEQKIRDLIKKGGMSALEPEIKDISYYTDSHNESINIINFDSIQDLNRTSLDLFDIEYYYYFDVKSQQWYAADHNYNFKSLLRFQELEIVVRHFEQLQNEE